jgi:serine/threonine protein phosphatase 1
MATYVMSDIHGCLNEVKRMLKLINFSDEDKLIFAGDYVDRGLQNKETLEWMTHAPENIIFLRGNHDEDFANDIRAIEAIVKSDSHIYNNNEEIYYDVKLGLYDFDPYGTVLRMLTKENAKISDLINYKNWIKKLPYYYKETINGKNFIIVHAGYMEEKDFHRGYFYKNIEQYYVWAREDAYAETSGIPNTTIIAGHTPTVIPGEFCYTGGKVYKQYNEANNCTLYDIDCGCVFGVRNYKDSDDCRLACIRLDDEEIFYINPKEAADDYQI